MAKYPEPKCPICKELLVKLEDTYGEWWCHPDTGFGHTDSACILDRGWEDRWIGRHRLEAWIPKKDIKPFVIYIDDDGKTTERDDGVGNGCGTRHQAIITVGDVELCSVNSMSNIVIKYENIEKYL